jgi:hypothetical protein
MLGFVSREMYETVLAERERLIVALRAQIAGLEKRMAEPISVTVALPKDFAIIQPALVSKPKRKKDLDPNDLLPAAPNIDLADLDERDDATLATVAFAKYGRRPANTWELKQWIRGIQVEVRAAKAARRRKREQERQDPPLEETQLQTGLELDEPIDESKIPAHIRESIAAAERGE